MHEISSHVTIPSVDSIILTQQQPVTLELTLRNTSSVFPWSLDPIDASSALVDGQLCAMLRYFTININFTINKKLFV